LCGSWLKKIHILIVFIALGTGLYAQEPGQLGVEIQNLERRLSDTRITAAERYDTLTRLARLQQLSGDINGAASNWLDAAILLPGEPSDIAIVSGAYCLAVAGEWERAVTVIQPFIASNRKGPLMIQARYLVTSLRVWMSTSNASGGDAAAPLAALARDQEFIDLRPAIYYTLWRTLVANPGMTGAGTAETWRTRLLNEFPNSPEARLANPAFPDFTALQRPLWLLVPERTANPAPPQTRPPEPPPARPPQTQPGPSTVTMLQTGVFGREANARNQAGQLQRAGFTPTITRRVINDGERWIVTVPGGPDPNKTLQDLKRAGFSDSFPIR